MKLNKKIFILMAVGFTITIAVVGFFSFLFVQSALEESISTNQLQVALTTMSQIDGILYKQLLNIEVIANDREVSGVLFESINGSEPKLRLRSLRTLTGPWDVLRIYDLKEEVVLSTREEEIGSMVKDTSLDFLLEKALSGTVTSSDFVKILETGRETVVFASPIRAIDEPGQPIIGVAVGYFSWPVILQVIEDLKLHAVLLNKEGLVIAANTRYDTENFKGINYGDKEFVSKLLEGSSESLVLSKDEGFSDRSMVASLAPQLGQLDYQGNGWGLVVETPTDVAFASAREEAIKLVGILIALFFIFVGGMAFSMRGIVVRPIVSLTNVAQSIAEGDLNKKVEVKSKDEIGQLGDAFNVMTSKLKQSYAGLEEKVRVRTKELLASNMLKDLFMDIMRHDLLNPAGIIRTNTQLVLGEEKDMKKKEALEAIERNSNRMITMIQNASIIAKLESGEKIDFKEEDLGVMLRGSVEELSERAKEKGMKVRVIIDGKFLAVVNPLIQNVFSNFISNAIKYSPEKSEIIVGIKGKGKDWLVYVEDQGEGIPTKYKKAIFERFTRLEKGAIKGSGLGLAISKKIAEAHNGKVWVRNHKGGGSVFYVLVPKVHAGRVVNSKDSGEDKNGK